MKRILAVLVSGIVVTGLACTSAGGPVPPTPVGGGPKPTATFPPGMAARGGGGGGAVSPEQGKQLFSTKGCVGCHKVKEVPGAVGEVGPPLDGIGNTSAHPRIAGVLENNPDNLKRWLANPPGVKPGTQMPNLGLSAREVDSLVAFLQTLK